MLIMSSQKTMPFAVSIIALLPPSLGSKGLLTLPPLVSQVGSSSYSACRLSIECHQVVCSKLKAAISSVDLTSCSTLDCQLCPAHMQTADCNQSIYCKAFSSEVKRELSESLGMHGADIPAVL